MTDFLVFFVAKSVTTFFSFIVIFLHTHAPPSREKFFFTKLRQLSRRERRPHSKMSSLQDFFHRVLTHETAIKKALEACEAEDIYAVDDLRLISNQNNLDKVFTQGTCAHISAALLPVATIELLSDHDRTLIPVAYEVEPLNATSAAVLDLGRVAASSSSSSAGESKSAGDGGERGERGAKKVTKKVTEERVPVLYEVSVVGNGRGFPKQFKHDSKFDVASLSITMWVKKKNNSYNWLVSRSEWTEGYSVGILATRDCRGAIRVSFGSDKDYIVGTTTIKKNLWYHVGVTFDAETGVGCLYVNGTCEKRSDFGSKKQLQYHNEGLFLGGEALGLGTRYRGAKPRHFLHGEIRELMIVDFVKTENVMEVEYQRLKNEF